MGVSAHGWTLLNRHSKRRKCALVPAKVCSGPNESTAPAQETLLGNADHLEVPTATAVTFRPRWHGLSWAICCRQWPCRMQPFILGPPKPRDAAVTTASTAPSADGADGDDGDVNAG
eukprot:355557-Chlamydomonas_euryale.AAC.1